MKIVVSAIGRDIESNIDSIFHRCAFFLIVDTKSNSLRTLVNTARESLSEIGAMVGQIVAKILLVLQYIVIVILPHLLSRGKQKFSREN